MEETYRERLEIRRRGNVANLKSGYMISDIWDAYLDLG